MSLPAHFQVITLDAMVEVYKTDLKTHFSQTSLNNLDTAIRQFKEFLNTTPDPKWQSLAPNLFGDFVVWLSKRESSNAPAGQSPATRSGVMNALSRIVTRSDHADITTNPRHDEFKTTSSTSSPAAC